MFTKDSAYFSQLYQLPTPDDTAQNGSSDVDPITLNDVSETDFLHILRILYPLTISGYPKCAERWTEAEWKPIFHFARQWQMSALLAESSTRLRACASPFIKISIGRSAELPDWVREGLVEISLRSEPLTDDKGITLELSDILKISRAREGIRSEVMRTGQRSEWCQLRMENAWFT
ncbi:hypothetical protein BU17DRAFT_86882 [Hysterangium stoloniferum]|nr:hypothetical protein BU17DRAFT_86882 [Hysterangium stoloniferum]